jgi:hypothetical protein
MQQSLFGSVWVKIWTLDPPRTKRKCHRKPQEVVRPYHPRNVSVFIKSSTNCSERHSWSCTRDGTHGGENIANNSPLMYTAIITRTICSCIWPTLADAHSAHLYVPNDSHIEHQLFCTHNINPLIFIMEALRVFCWDRNCWIFGPKRDEVMGEWRKLHNEELRDMYSSPSIIRIIKSRIRWAGHVARMGRRGTRVDYWWESQRERELLP